MPAWARAEQGRGAVRKLRALRRSRGRRARGRLAAAEGDWRLQPDGNALDGLVRSGAGAFDKEQLVRDLRADTIRRSTQDSSVRIRVRRRHHSSPGAPVAGTDGDPRRKA